ncbi:MAG: HPr family phosphocarrier protein [Lachnospiraceae bacterium]|nr:HPr family phosphocarrier protein [Lachnospiraceae bacterium]
MKTKTMEVKLDKGLEARPVALLVQEASKYRSKVYIEYGDKRINAKSIMGMMNLPLGSGEEIKVVVEGDDESEALEGIDRFLSSAAV